MRQYERNDVIIDQCTECGGIFLDRGELERLAQAEANYYNPQAAQPLPPRPHDDEPRRYVERREGSGSRDDRGPRDDRGYRDGRDDRDGGHRDDRVRRDDRDRGYRDDPDRRYRDDRDDRGFRDERDYRRDRDHDPRYGSGAGRYGKRRKKEGFFGELMDLLD
jgi:Zn-finger nucleic acid-binding protein